MVTGSCPPARAHRILRWIAANLRIGVSALLLRRLLRKADDGDRIGRGEGLHQALVEQVLLSKTRVGLDASGCDSRAIPGVPAPGEIESNDFGIDASELGVLV